MSGYVDDIGDDDFDLYDGYECYYCAGTGEVMVCPDDMCRGVGECAFGGPDSGCYAPCPMCSPPSATPHNRCTTPEKHPESITSDREGET